MDESKKVYRKFLPEQEYTDSFKKRGKTIPPFLVMQPYVIRNGVPGYMVLCKPSDPRAELWDDKENEMPTDEHNQELEQLKEAIGKAQAAPQRESSYEDMISFYMKKTLETMRRAKPEIRSEMARRYAVAITDMEKTFAYFHTYIVNFDSNVENWDK